MKRKIGEIFGSEFYGKKYRVEKSTLSYPSKCKDCDFYIANSCNGCLDETGDCRPYDGEIGGIELIFKEIKEK